MIKIILSLFAALTVLCGASIVFYWRDTAYDPNGFELLGWLLLLPAALTAGLLMPYFIYKLVKKSQKMRQDQAEQTEQQEQERQNAVQHQPAEKQPSRQFLLHVYSSAVWHSFGENESIIEQFKQFKSPELDAGLLNAYGLPILSLRIQELDDSLISEEEHEDAQRSTMREKRIGQLIQHQLQQHANTLFSVADHLKRSAMFYDSELAYEYRMHPAWHDPDMQENEDAGQPVAQVQEVSRLDRLALHILLPENLIHHWNEAAREKLLLQLAEEYGILQDQIEIEHHFFSQATAYREWLKLLEQISQQTHVFSLIISADSEIDQEWIDEKLWQSDHYIASEFSSGWCVAGAETQICDLMPARTLKISLNEEHPAEFLAQHQMESLAQFEQDEPFMLMLDDASDIKTSKCLQQKFSGTAIETHHFVFTQPHFGHTQQLAKICAFMLGMHLPDELVGMMYSTEHDSAYAFLKAFQPALEIDFVN